MTSETEATAKVNIAKASFGNGVSTKILIHNTGKEYGLMLDGTYDSSGYWSSLSPPKVIAPGSWAGMFHRKTSGSATGSCGSMRFKVVDKEAKVMQKYFHIGWDTPFSGRNTVWCSTDATPRSLEEVHKNAENGTAAHDADQDSYTIKTSTDQDSTATVTIEINADKTLW
jgi:hypothetical protein